MGSSIAAIFAQAGQQAGQHGMGGIGWMWGMHWLWWIFWLVVAALVVWALVSAVGDGRSDGGPSGRPERESPEEALRRRYADGEIDEEEYRERLRVLRSEDTG